MTTRHQLEQLRANPDGQQLAQRLLEQLDDTAPTVGARLLFEFERQADERTRRVVA